MKIKTFTGRVLKSSYFYTYLTEFLVLFTTILLYKLPVILFSEEAFAEYSLSRRALSTMLPVLAFGVGVAVPRYTALCREEKMRTEVLQAGLMINLPLILGIWAWGILSPESFSYLFFGSEAYNNFTIPVIALVTGLLLHSLIYGFFRGSGMMRVANSFQIVNLCFIPVASFFFPDEISGVLLYTGLLSAIVSVFVIISLSGSAGFRLPTSAKVRELFVYGVQRVPGDIAFAVFISAPAFVVAHTFNDVRLGGFVAFAITILNIFGTFFSPVSLLLLPEITSAMADGKFDLVRKRFRAFTIFTLLLSISMALGFILVSEPLLESYLNGVDKEQLRIVYIIIAGCIPFSLFISLRSFLDAIFHKALNSVNLIAALGLLLGGYAVGWGFKFSLDYYLWIYVLGHLFLGLLTFLKTRQAMGNLENLRLK